MLPITYLSMRSSFEIFRRDNHALQEILHDIDSRMIVCMTNQPELELWKTFRSQVNQQILLNELREECDGETTC